MTLPVHSFILLGQSNMCGRGDFGEVPVIRHERILMMRNSRWQPMSEPIVADRCVFGSWHSGTCLAASFALDYVNAVPDVSIGLVPCADGGTNLYEDWQPGGLLFDNAVFMTRQAQRTSKVMGILWHQGEGDTGSPEIIAAYRRNFETIVGAFRRATGLEGVPMVIGELGHYLEHSYRYGERLVEGHKAINRIMHEIAADTPEIALATAEGLSPKLDQLHFDSISLREFGHRYFRAYQSLLPR